MLRYGELHAKSQRSYGKFKESGNHINALNLQLTLLNLYDLYIFYKPDQVYFLLHEPSAIPSNLLNFPMTLFYLPIHHTPAQLPSVHFSNLPMLLLTLLDLHRPRHPYTCIHAPLTSSEPHINHAEPAKHLVIPNSPCQAVFLLMA